MASDGQLQQLIIDELNISGDSTFVANLPIWWSIFSGSYDQYLTFLLTKKRAITYLMGKARKLIDLTLGGDTTRLNQEFKNLVDMLKEVNDEIKANGGALGAATLVTTAPITSGPDSLQEEYDYLNNYWNGTFVWP